MTLVNFLQNHEEVNESVDLSIIIASAVVLIMLTLVTVVLCKKSSKRKVKTTFALEALKDDF